MASGQRRITPESILAPEAARLNGKPNHHFHSMQLDTLRTEHAEGLLQSIYKAEDEVTTECFHEQLCWLPATYKLDTPRVSDLLKELPSKTQSVFHEIWHGLRIAADFKHAASKSEWDQWLQNVAKVKKTYYGGLA
jgi:hypothetical protein